MLASCGDDNNVHLWDTFQNKLLYSFIMAHHSPVNDLKFSPSMTGAALLASIGLDKQICFYDVNDCKPVTNILTDYPLTSFDFHADGRVVALGT